MRPPAVITVATPPPPQSQDLPQQLNPFAIIQQDRFLAGRHPASVPVHLLAPVLSSAAPPQAHLSTTWAPANPLPISQQLDAGPHPLRSRRQRKQWEQQQFFQQQHAALLADPPAANMSRIPTAPATVTNRTSIPANFLDIDSLLFSLAALQKNAMLPAVPASKLQNRSQLQIQRPMRNLLRNRKRSAPLKHLQQLFRQHLLMSNCWSKCSSFFESD